MSDHEGSAQRERLELSEGVSVKCHAHSAAGWRPFEVLVTVAPGLHSVTPILSFTSDQCSPSAGLVALRGPRTPSDPFYNVLAEWNGLGERTIPTAASPSDL